MKISIITVVLNSVDTITRALDSIYSQTYKNIEHIVVDGGSNDGTIEIIKIYSKNIASFISEPDNGIYDAMNKGVALATGDVIAFLNADDMYAGAWVLSEVAENFTSLSLDAVFGNLSYFHSNKIDQPCRVYKSPNNVCEALSWGFMPAHPTLFLSKEVFAQYGVFDSNYKIAGDFDLIARAFKSNTLRYKNLNKVMVKMQLGGVSTAGIKSTILLNNEIYRSCCKNLIRTNYLKLYARYPKKVLEFFHFPY